MKKRILIVEDFHITRLVIRKVLESMGFSVNEACDGKDALKFLDGSCIDLVITDYNMPNMDGASLAMCIREMDDYRCTPILMLTAEISAEKFQRAKDARITALIRKPFDISDLKKQVQKILAK